MDPVFAHTSESLMQNRVIRRKSGTGKVYGEIKRNRKARMDCDGLTGMGHEIFVVKTVLPDYAFGV